MRYVQSVIAFRNNRCTGIWKLKLSTH